VYSPTGTQRRGIYTVQSYVHGIPGVANAARGPGNPGGGASANLHRAHRAVAVQVAFERRSTF
jgi:hypothetical protein